MEIWCNRSMSVLISFLGILSRCVSLFDCSWMAPLTPNVIMMRVLTCHPIVLSACMSGLYLAVFSPWAVLGNLS